MNVKLLASSVLLVFAVMFLFAKLVGGGEEKPAVKNPPSTPSLQSPEPPSISLNPPETVKPLGEPKPEAELQKGSELTLQKGSEPKEFKEELQPKKESEPVASNKASNKECECKCPEERKVKRERKEKVAKKQEQSTVKSEKDGKSPSKKEEKPAEKVDGHILSGYGLVCKIGGDCVLYKDGQVVREGDTIPQGKVLRISPSGVVLEKDGRLKQVDFQ